MKNKLTVFVLPILAIVTGCSDQESDLTTSQTPIFNTSMPLSLVMEHVVTPAAFGVWSASGIIVDAAGERSLEPKTENEWEVIVNHAATLLESTNSLLLPGRVVDQRWQDQVIALANTAQQALAAAEERDAKAIAAAGDALVEVCSGCHQVYNIPEEY